MSPLVHASAFAAGAWILHRQPVLTSLTGFAAVVPLLICVWLILRRARGETGAFLRAAVLAATFGLGGFLWAGAFAHIRMAQSMPEHWQGRDMQLEGVIAEMTRRSARGTRIVFDVERVHTAGAGVPPRISLGWYEDPPAVDGGEPVLRAGQRWRLTARLRRPHGYANPHGFDLEAWLLERDIRASGYVRRAPAPRLLAQRVARPRYLIEAVRESVRTRLERTLEAKPYRGVIAALAIGDQRSIEPAHWKAFTRTGTNHLVAISGLHITMVAGLVFALVSWAWRRSERLAAALPAARAGVICGAGAALAYAALSGFALPAQRAVTMLLVVAVALWSGWRWPPATVLAIALFAVLLIDPMAVQSAGFWLSFGAVAAILLATVPRLRGGSWAVELARTQWAVTIALVPLLLALFGQVSLVSPLANAVAIPAVSLVVAPLSLLGIVLPFDWIAHAAHTTMSWCMWFLQALAAFPDVAWQQHAPPVWSIPLALAGAAWMLLPRGFPARWLGLVAMLPLFLAAPARPAPGELWLTVLDVGQGLAVVARTHSHTLLYDAGPALSGAIDAGERVVVPYLRGEGLRRLDGMLVSHDDIDHSGGAASVLSAVPVARLWSSLPDAHPVGSMARRSQRCARGQHWEWDAVTFAVLHPPADSYNDSRISDNDRSCVLRISSAHGTVLIPGDIELRTELALLRAAGGELAAEVLVAPHHGSRSSSSAAFVAAVAPRHVVFSAGRFNRHGHPHPQVVARYRSLGAGMYRTDVGGAVSVRFGADGIRVSEWRAQAPRFWYAQ